MIPLNVAQSHQGTEVMMYEVLNIGILCGAKCLGSGLFQGISHSSKVPDLHWR